ncbi:MAG: VCBS repeat-containing protein, partial [Cyclobacteriaceae bacterium]
MRLLALVVFLMLIGCSEKENISSILFSDITAESGILFRNDLSITGHLNPYTYRNFYNGAGVAIGDVNNDGLQDIYFAGNQADNKLYLNQGGLVFKDITETAGVACSGVWSTGVTFADLNADGFLDIYVCKSGSPNVANRHNEVFINNGDLTFTESAKEYGLDIVGLSVQAAFFDFDMDSDLDCYLLTNSFKSIGNFDLIKDQRKIPDPLGGGNKFFINENGKFRDYTEEAGIYSSSIGFGLGITLGDFNSDHWTDIFISNDFFERDYLYINNRNGSFTESLTDYFESISMGSMGADYADLDNDGSPELFVTEMLPDSLHRKKTKTIYESWDKYQLNVKNGYHHQFSRNVLQKKTGKNSYVELGRLSGIAASEWSWGALLFDMDNDGKKDVFIANGIYKDLLDRDYLTYAGVDENVRKLIREEENAIVKLIDLMPSSEFPNYAFRNDGNLRFKNITHEWGLGEPMFSSGSAYGDFDNDGDLDLVVNNINAPSVIYRNNSDSSKYKSITLSLSAEGRNRFAIGSEITVFSGSKTFFFDNFVTRGFQSSVQPKVTIGLGEGVESIDSLQIRWPDKGYTILYDIRVNQNLHINRGNSKVHQEDPFGEVRNSKPLLMEPFANALFSHQGSGLNDFNRDRLLPMMYGNETPSMLKGDIDNDGIEEVYVGGGRNQSGAFIRFKSGKFESFLPKAIGEYSLPEETEGALVDVDNDGDLDLYLASGGRFFPRTSSVLMDKLFLNDG